MRHDSNRLTRDFHDLQTEYARLCGIESDDQTRKQSWILKSYHAISCQLCTQDFLPHACFQWDDWMEYSRIELREGMVSRRKLWDAMVGFLIYLRVCCPMSVLANNVRQVACYRRLSNKYGFWKTIAATPELLERMEEGKSLWRLVFRVPVHADSYDFGMLSLMPFASALTDLPEIWEPKTPLTVQKPLNPPPPNRWDSQYDEAWRARHRGLMRLLRIEETEANRDSSVETLSQTADGDFNDPEGWELLEHWDIEAI